jgi:hypothetical protein
MRTKYARHNVTEKIFFLVRYGRRLVVWQIATFVVSFQKDIAGKNSEAEPRNILPGSQLWFAPVFHIVQGCAIHRR